MRCVVVVEDKGLAVLCSLTNKMQDMNQIAWNEVYISLLPGYTSILSFTHSKHTTSTYTNCQHPELSLYYVICTKQYLRFQNTSDNLHNFVNSLWASFHYVQLYQNANASDVDSFSTRSDSPKERQQRNREGNCEGKKADISYKSTPVVESGPYKRIHLGTHLLTHMDIQCLQRQGWEGLGPLLWYNLSWSSQNSPLFTILADVAPPQKQEFAFSGVVGSVPLIYGANVWQNLRSNEQLKVGQPTCLQGSSRSLQSADNPLGKGYTHSEVFSWYSSDDLRARLSHQAAVSTSQETSWPLDHGIGMR